MDLLEQQKDRLLDLVNILDTLIKSETTDNNLTELIVETHKLDETIDRVETQIQEIANYLVCPNNENQNEKLRELVKEYREDKRMVNSFMPALILYRIMQEGFNT